MRGAFMMILGCSLEVGSVAKVYGANFVAVEVGEDTSECGGS